MTAKDKLSFNALNMIDNRNLVMYMKNTNTVSRLKHLFIVYHSILCRPGVGWLLEINQNFSVQQILDAVKLLNIRQRPESEVKNSYSNFKIGLYRIL